MEHTADGKQSDAKPSELGTFYVGDAIFGMNILKIEEINKLQEITKVPQSPDYVLGLMNLRGRIITIIDLGKKLGLPPSRLTSESRNIIVTSQGEHVGLLVDRIGDVVSVDPGKVTAPPANVRGVQGSFLQGVFRTDKNLIAILDAEKVIAE